jgi:hypothetical protein
MLDAFLTVESKEVGKDSEPTDAFKAMEEGLDAIGDF